MSAKSPYNWQSHSPGVQIPRADVGRVAELLRENGSAVVMGGRGMGKSVFLGQVKTELEQAVEGSPVLARWTCLSATDDGMDVQVEHLLLRLARRS